MNSLFSSFDAACAELLGKTLKASFPSFSMAGDFVQKQDSKIKAMGGVTKEKGANQSPSSHVSKPKVTAARYAPELDGLNCFETLIRY
ncbi:hypothetical protein LguiA_015862 [Lonicera macranthoides]